MIVTKPKGSRLLLSILTLLKEGVPNFVGVLHIDESGIG
jgi:hypothetical protein